MLPGDVPRYDGLPSFGLATIVCLPTSSRIDFYSKEVKRKAMLIAYLPDILLPCSLSLKQLWRNLCCRSLLLLSEYQPRSLLRSGLKSSLERVADHARSRSALKTKKTFTALTIKGGETFVNKHFSPSAVAVSPSRTAVSPSAVAVSPSAVAVSPSRTAVSLHGSACRAA